MPDLRPVQQFGREIARIETDYLKAVRKSAGQTRLILLEHLIRQGTSDPNLSAIFRHELDDLRRAVRGHGQDIIKLDQAAKKVAGKQFNLIEKLTGQKIDIDLAGSSTAGEQAGIVGRLGESLTGWIDQVDIWLRTELDRMRAGGEAVDAVANRLLDEKLADGRVSVWRRAIKTAALETSLNVWTAATNITNRYYDAGQSQAGQTWRKQVIAGIDERTTDCCLRVHGQIQELDNPFKLTGTPRFADEKQHPPFHHYCRTAETLYMEEFEQVGVTTDDMRDAAQAEIKARAETGTTVEIHPASATSRR